MIRTLYWYALQLEEFSFFFWEVPTHKRIDTHLLRRPLAYDCERMQGCIARIDSRTRMGTVVSLSESGYLRLSRTPDWIQIPPSKHLEIIMSPPPSSTHLTSLSPLSPSPATLESESPCLQHGHYTASSDHRLTKRKLSRTNIPNNLVLYISLDKAELNSAQTLVVFISVNVHTRLRNLQEEQRRTHTGYQSIPYW